MKLSVCNFKILTIFLSMFWLGSIAVAQNPNSNPNAQTPWKLNGSQADTTQFVGTTNNVDLVFKRNNIEGFRLLEDTAAKFFGDVYLNKFRIHPTPPPSSGPIQEERILSINSVGQIALSNLTIPQDDTYVCSYVTPWIYANGTTTDDNIALCPNFKSVTIAGDLTIGGITRLNSTGIGVAANNDTQLNIRSVGKEVSMRLFTIPTTTTKYAFQNRVTTSNIIAYSVTNHNTNQDVFVVKGDGSVGIGTDKTTGFMLSVEGDVRTRSIQVDASTLIWSDFVFSNEYKLNDLLEVENFIKTNKHLPDVPSEKEVKEKGINLAEMDAILLQKIEELTLYIIQQEKRIKELEQQVKK